MFYLPTEKECGISDSNETKCLPVFPSTDIQIPVNPGNSNFIFSDYFQNRREAWSGRYNLATTLVI